MVQPWERADAQIDEALAARLIAAQFPALAGAPVTFLDEGWGSRVFVVGDGWMFRFPKIRAADGDLGVELALLSQLAPRLPVAIPRFEHIGRPDLGYPFRFLGYRRIAGAMVQEAWPSFDPARLGTALGRAFSAIHSFPVEAARAAGVTEDALRIDLTTHWERAQKYLVGLTPEELPRVASLQTPPPSYDGPLRFIHGDILPNHVLVDGGELSGLLDWGDVTLGDPAVDLGGVLYIAGPAALDACLAAYDLPLDDGARARARFSARYAALMDVAWGRATGRRLETAAALRGLDHCESW